jgi:hypothetical protein
MREMKNLYTILARTLKGRDHFGDVETWEDNTKIGIGETACVGVE